MEYYEKEYKNISIRENINNREKDQFNQYKKLLNKIDYKRENLIFTLKCMPIGFILTLILIFNGISFIPFVNILVKLIEFVSETVIMTKLSSIFVGLMIKADKERTVEAEAEYALEKRIYPNEKDLSKKKYKKTIKRLSEIFGVPIEELESKFNEYSKFMNFIDRKREMGEDFTNVNSILYPRQFTESIFDYDIYFGEELVTPENINQLLPRDNTELVDGHTALDQVRKEIENISTISSKIETGIIDVSPEKDEKEFLIDKCIQLLRIRKQQLVCSEKDKYYEERIQYLGDVEQSILINSIDRTPVIARVTKEKQYY